MEKEEVTQTPGMYSLSIYIKYVDLKIKKTITSRRALWSESCTPNLHSKGKMAFKRVGDEE